MVIAHGLPFIGDRIPDSAAFVLQQVNDLASPLFALVMGVSAGLVLRRSEPARAETRAVVKGLVLVLLGVLLEQLDHWVAVILHILGLLLIVGTPLLRLGSRWLVGLASACFVAGPWLIQRVTRAAGGTAGGQPPVAPWSTNPLLQWLLLNPHYRVLTLLPVFLLGAVLARRGLGDERTAWWCALVGLVMVWASFAAELLGHPVRFSGDLHDQVQENGLALAAYGVVMATGLARARERSPYAVLPRLALVGRVALSLYVAHVLLLVPLIARFPEGGWSAMVILLSLSLAGAWAWARFVGLGPVEWALERIAPPRRARGVPAA
jgi:uncharacterized membrane protein